MSEEEVMKNLSVIEYYKEQLSYIDAQLQYLQAMIEDNLKSRMTLEQLKKNQDVSETLVPIGTGVFIHASLKDTSKALIDIGAGVVAEKNIDEAIQKIDKRIEEIQRNQERLYSMSDRIQQETEDLSAKTQRMIEDLKKK
ncbi:MAG: prefoldin subunit alpha [Candidatus Thermoplasmatota archaeon]